MNERVTIEYKINSSKKITIEVSSDVNKVLEQTDRTVHSQRRQDRRHIDFTPMTDEFLELSLRTASEDTSAIYEKMERNEELYSAVEQLSEIQKRRICLYYFLGKNQHEIAKLEKVNDSAIGRSLVLARKQLKRILEEE